VLVEVARDGHGASCLSLAGQGNRTAAHDPRKVVECCVDEELDADCKKGEVGQPRAGHRLGVRYSVVLKQAGIRDVEDALPDRRLQASQDRIQVATIVAEVDPEAVVVVVVVVVVLVLVLVVAPSGLGGEACHNAVPAAFPSHVRIQRVNVVFPHHQTCLFRDALVRAVLFPAPDARVLGDPVLDDHARAALSLLFPDLSYPS